MALHKVLEQNLQCEEAFCIIILLYTEKMCSSQFFNLGRKRLGWRSRLRECWKAKGWNDQLDSEKEGRKDDEVASHETHGSSKINKYELLKVVRAS